MKYKRNIFILLTTFFIFILLKYIQANVLNSNKQVDVYIANTYIQKGDKITEDKINKIKVNLSLIQKLEYINNLEELNNHVAKYDLLKGQILLNEIFQNSEQYVANNIQNELISLNVSNAYDFASYQITKDSTVNIYYTGKAEFVEKIINNIDRSSVIVSGDNGYISFKLLENVKIKNIYDKYGNIISFNNNQKDNEVLIDSIVIEVDTNMAVNINNLKKYGEFSITVLK